MTDVEDSWRTLVQDASTTRRAEALIDRVAAMYSRMPDEAEPGLEAGLAEYLSDRAGTEGPAAASLLFAYLYLERGQDDAFGGAIDWLNRAIATSAKDGEAEPWLFYGVAGTAWAVAHLRSRLVDSEGEDADPNDDVDEALIAFVRDSDEPIDPELVVGLAGIGTYFLERLPHEQARYGLGLVVDRLRQQAELVSSGYTWRKPLEALDVEEQARFPRGLHNLGIAHGAPGVLAFLARVCSSKAATPAARELLEGGIGWLLTQRAPRGPAAFPYHSAPHCSPWDADSRIAWCYGDLGNSVVLLQAARALGRTDWETEAVSLAAAAAHRPDAESGVSDAMICHGAAGNAHMFNRLYQASGEPLFRDAALKWYRSALRYGESVVDAIDGQPKFASFYGLAVGVSGLALVLLAGIGRVAPDWDRVFSIAVPVRSFENEVMR